MGWLRDLPDFRDYTAESPKIVPQLDAIGIAQPMDLAVPAKVDLRAYCSPVEDQGRSARAPRTRSSGSSSTSSAARTASTSTRRGCSSTRRRATCSTGRATPARTCARRSARSRSSAFRRRSTGRTRSPLRHRAERVLLRVRARLPGDLVLPPRPARHDAVGSADEDQGEPRRRPAVRVRLHRLQLDLAGGEDGPDPVSGAGEKVIGGHAMLVVGYDDNMTITNTNNGERDEGRAASSGTRGARAGATTATARSRTSTSRISSRSTSGR